jgi:hypothetical protein
MTEGTSYILCFEEDGEYKPLPEHDCSQSEFDCYRAALDARDELIESDGVVIVKSVVTVIEDLTQEEKEEALGFLK